MILDERTEFCDATAANTGGAASYLLGDVVDLTVSRDLGPGEPATYCVITVDTTFTSGGSGTYAFSLCSDAQAAIAVDGTQTVHFKTALIPVATLVAGYVIAAFPLPAGKLYERFLGIVQETAVAAATAGKINAFITSDASVWRAYADAAN